MAPFPPGPEDYRPYLCSGAELAESYVRCRASGVLPELARPRKILPPARLTSRLKANAALLTLVERFITPVGFTSPQRSYIYILCDKDLVALKIFAAADVLAATEKAGVKPGTVFTEASCGTNALALAREHQRLVAIRGEQHYCRLFKDWWCVASPLKDPEGEILGYLDISMHAEKELGLAAAHLRTLVDSMQREFLLLELSQRGQADLLAPVSLHIPPEVERKLTRREREVLQLILDGWTMQRSQDDFI
ncbi:helix-turn-helix transcriptional regulator [Thermodesulfitimonas autotrophica]|uniref:helix-turn-helix transcriptional regulator n=1 Tax=Thermodesulfitimonas autotrophica TaxID=1894989 RepID=UPI001FEAFD6C|nr:helix-turn-helix transcriptional regulator [Thermodesulfitimonas autotrophica]